MASEFTRKIQRIKDILTFNSILADDGDILLTKSGDVYTQVNGKVKQLSNPNYGAGNVNKILAVSDNGEVVPIQMPSAGDILGKDNTFTGNNTFDNPINTSLSTRVSTFTDYADVAKNTIKYAGNWSVYSSKIKNDPTGANGGLLYYQVTVTPAYVGLTGSITIKTLDGKIYETAIDDGKIKGWNLIPHDNDLLHNSGNETASGDKTFNGQTTLLNGDFGLRVTNSGIVKTTDAGKTWVAL